ncbi:GNAT family N-acetyltransferase [Vibrio breoganii]|uniref:GNAT family N-acetyltransferase n=1 Tax=Vibrio breoganii TaxID=553239 RepID=UPI000C847243|nr:GNAT family N-acetyltransferase [Vibrio breoganii]PML12208.1 GNAT family N-acetyltransferase [Vibrio breoganii]
MDVTFTRVTNPQQIDIVVDLANIIWTEHYTPIIGAEQVHYMLTHIHSPTTIATEIKDSNIHYYLIHKDGKPAGYVGLKLQPEQLFLSKIYVLSSERGNGIGALSINFIKDLAKSNNLNKIFLTVNKYNAHSIAAYQRIGFEITEEIVADIGGGYVMDDYKMELNL